MRLLTDTNVFLPMVDELRNLGHDVFDIKEQKLIRKKFEFAKKNCNFHFRCTISMHYAKLLIPQTLHWIRQRRLNCQKTYC